MGLTSEQFEPNGQLALSRNHVIKSWVTYRIAKGKTGSTISLQGAYYAGDHQSLTNPFTYPVETVVGTQDTTRPLSTSLFYNGRGNYSGPSAAPKWRALGRTTGTPTCSSTLRLPWWASFGFSAS